MYLIELEIRRQARALTFLGNSLSSLWQILSGPGHDFLDSLKISSNSSVVITTQSCSESTTVPKIALV